MLRSLIDSKQLQIFENSCFNTSRGTIWDTADFKNFDFRRVLRRLKLAGQLIYCIRKLPPVIIHFHCGSFGLWDFLGDMLLFLVLKLFRKKTVFHWHCDPVKGLFPGHSICAQTFFQFTAGSADALIVISEKYRQALPSIYAAKTFVVPNTFDASLLSLPCPRPSRNYVQVIFIGRLTREKGIWDLFDIASIVVNKIYNVRFVVAGVPNPGECGMDHLQKAIVERGLEKNISFVGSVVNGQKLQFFSEGDVMLFPSHRESFGITALEGMASGIPVLAYSIGLLPDLIGNGLAGFLVDLGNIYGLASRLLQLIEDPGLRARMGQSGREEAKNKFAPELVATRVQGIYSGLSGLDPSVV